MLEYADATSALLRVSLFIPPGLHVYADTLTLVTPPDTAVAGSVLPKPERKPDPLTNEDRDQYAQDIDARYFVTGNVPATLAVTVQYQGCDETTCFMPARDRYSLTTVSAASAPEQPAASANEEISNVSATVHQQSVPDWRERLQGFQEKGRAVGYLKPDAFMAFLQGRTATAEGFGDRSMWVVLVLILLGGLLLNLTPCVLPMIPINLAIIGAGTQAGSRRRGLLLGGIYGLGIAVAYGVLGVVVVVTGSRFGALNSTVWFNAAIAVLFVVLALALLDVIPIDFTRYQPAALRGTVRQGSVITAGVMGAVAALLAGACVAPVVINVLVLATTLYSDGSRLALALPFVLGLGMALPWPVVGAGFALLPKPGAWMVHIKRGFAVIIALLALWYGYEAVRLARGSRAATADGWLTSLPEALNVARATQKPVVIDFWASWCKNCVVMDSTTFRNDAVRDALHAMVPVKIQAERLDDPAVQPILDHFRVIGLPTYIILEPSTEVSQ